MSMTPLQAIAATKFVNGEGIAAHRMQSVADAYSTHPMVALLRSRSDIQAAIDAVFPAASGGVRASDATFFSTFGSATNIEDAIVEYANYVLCGGDLGKFASVVDKCSGLMTAIGDVTATIEKASTMKFSDFGPGVTNYGDAINMGLGGATAKLKEAMEQANNGQLPQVQGVPQTDSAVVGTVILAQGEVSGDSASPNYGSAIGIYEAAKDAGLTDSINAIHQEFLKQSVTVVGKIKGTSGDYIRVAPVTNFTEAQFNEMMDLTYEAAVENDTSDNEVKRAESVTIKAWVESRRAKGFDSFMVLIHSVALKIMNDPDKYSVDILLKITADLTVRSETHMAEAIDALALEDAKKLFAGLKCKIQIEKLEKYTDVLDLAKCSAAMPEPLTTKTAPSAVTTAALDGDIDTAPPAKPSGTVPIPRIEGKLPTLPTNVTAFGAPPGIGPVSSTTSIANPYTGADAAKFSALSTEDQAWLTKGGGKPDISDPSILNRAPSKTGLGLSGVPSALGLTQTPSALGTKALEAAKNIKNSLMSGTASFDGISSALGGALGGVSLPAVPGRVDLAFPNIDTTTLPNPSSMSGFGADMGKIKGFGNLENTKSLGTMLRSVESSMPVTRGIPGLSSLTQPITVTDEDIEEARKLKSNKADVDAGKPPEEWNVTPEQYVRNSKLSKSLTPNLLNSFKDVMPPTIKTELQAAVGTGAGPGGSYTLTDFVGSAVGENGQVENWSTIIQSLDILWSVHEAELTVLVDEVLATSTLTNLESFMSGLTNTIEGVAATDAYEDSVNKIRSEYGLLINKAGIDFANIPANDLTGTLNLSKKLAQHASKLDSGHALIFQNAADPNTVGGQAMLGVMVEARNTKLLQSKGFSPANSIAKVTQATVSEQDKQEAAKIQAKSGDADAITPQQVANNRALNNTLKGLFGV